MALKLFKLVMSATTTTTTVPTVDTFIYTATANVSGTQLIVLATKFFTDSGTAAAALGTLSTNNGYYLLYVNGELQQSGVYTVGAAGSALTISDSAGFTLAASAPITLAVTNFAPSSSTVVTS